MSGIEVSGPKIMFEIPILGGITITETVVWSWCIIGVVFLLCLVLTHKLEKVPVKKTQQIAEKLVITMDSLVESSMGKNHMGYVPYIMALFTMSLFGSLISLLGLRPVTADINTTMSWAILTFLLIQFNGIKNKGIKGYLKGFVEPIPLLLPINIISEFSTPLSMGFRHFGNIAAGTIITSLVYGALAGLSSMVFGGLQIPVFQAGLPAVLSLYFDLFTAGLQAFIFCMLTMVFIANNDS